MQLEHVPLLGESVHLVPLTLEHVTTLFGVAMRIGETGALTIVPKSLEETERYVRTALAEQQAGRALPFAVMATHGPSGAELVGTTRFAAIEFWPSEDERPRTTPQVVEIGWTLLAREAQRTRINTEAKFLLLRHAFEHWGVERVTIKTDVRNERSRRAIERIGARFEGVLRRHMPAVDGGPRDTAMYSVVRPEWPDVSRDLRAKLTRASG